MTSQIPKNISIRKFSGNEIKPYIKDLALLRINVFFDFPYLYNGDMEYEEKYLSVYTKNEAAIVVVIFDGDKIVGASTGMPLTDETYEVRKPFLLKEMEIEDIFYFGESVLLQEYRGLGIGKIFFQEREKHALENGFKITTFCGVVRSDDHPLRPTDYKPLDGFWSKMGYSKDPNMIAEFKWLDRDKISEDVKQLVYWAKQHQ